jgi:6-phosphogluconolactonase (cycloisomerase 2 family)
MHNASRRRVGIQIAALGAALAAGVPALAGDDDGGSTRGRVYTSSNAPAGNELIVFTRDEQGRLEPMARAATGGQGSGAGLGSQGAVSLSSDGRFVFVVNAASHTVSTFSVRKRQVALVSVVDSGGLTPISVTESDGLVYVLNAGGSGNVAGFRNVGGELRPLPDGKRGLSAATGTNPAQVGFGADGDVLVVTEKATHRITGYAVRRDGTLGAPVATASAGLTPFGFAFDKRDHLIVSEAPGSAASSYRVDERTGAASVISASVPNTQAAACWVAVTPNGRYAYITNAGSSSVSSYRVAPGGSITLANAVAGMTGTGSSPADVAVSADGKHLYVRNGRSYTLSAFHVRHDGSLGPRPVLEGLPTTAVGLAAN